MKLVSKLLSVIKGREIELDAKIGYLYLSRLLTYKVLAFLRGVLTIQQCVFIGRGTVVMASGQLFADKGVEIGSYCQIDCLSHGGLYLGRGAKIGSFSVVKVSGSLSDLGDTICIGDNVGIGDFAHIGGAGRVSIGDDTITGAYLSIHPENHIFEDVHRPIRVQGVTRKGVNIGKGCWIGAKVTFLDGSSVGNGCVVAAGAVVNKCFSDNLIIAGVPAKDIGYRGGNKGDKL